jgi:hypothetical protein
VADADAMAKGIFPHAKSSSFTVTHIIDYIQLSFIVLSSVEADGMALAHHVNVSRHPRTWLFLHVTYYL